MESDRLIGDLTVADLQALITRIVQETIRQEREWDNSTRAETDRFLDTFLATYGAWEGERKAEEIVHEIYSTRTTP
jgi:hypothetical protein